MHIFMIFSSLASGAEELLRPYFSPVMEVLKVHLMQTGEEGRPVQLQCLGKGKREMTEIFCIVNLLLPLWLCLCFLFFFCSPSRNPCCPGLLTGEGIFPAFGWRLLSPRTQFVWQNWWSKYEKLCVSIRIPFFSLGLKCLVKDMYANIPHLTSLSNIFSNGWEVRISLSIGSIDINKKLYIY